ncbi:MAG: DedA family protein [Hyphomicrobiales bacterium]|nr:DedA family protein [Hyphomicrobiales bacterium]
MEEIGQLVVGLEHFVRAYGAPAVLVIIMLEAFGMPLPGETLLIFSAALAGRGEMSLPALLICAWAGAVIGDNIGYLIGRTLGRAAVARFGATIGLTESRFLWIEGVFARYGVWTVMFARFFNVLRQLNGIVAGTLGMSWWRFLICNAVGGALWVLMWMLGTFYLTEHASALAKAAHHVGIVGGLAAAAAVAAMLYALWRWRRPAQQTP